MLAACNLILFHTRTETYLNKNNIIMHMKECKMCHKKIDPRAKVCSHCGSDQRWLHRFLRDTGLINILAVLAVIFSFMQAENARQEKVLAEQAKKSAELALENTGDISIRFQQLARLYAEVSYIETNDYTILASGAISYPEIYSKKLDSLMLLIEPDSIKRSAWLESLIR